LLNNLESLCLEKGKEREVEVQIHRPSLDR
jgi:hypothetical protein